MTEAELLQDARRGDRGAFQRLVEPQLPVLRALIQRMVMHPQDAEDLVQDTLVKAMSRIDGFRGDGTFRSWLLSIGTRQAIDLLRTKKRWGLDAQSLGATEASSSPEILEEISDASGHGEFVYEFRQHVSYCFSCVARSLAPEVAAVLLLRDVFECSTREAAKITGLSQSVVRHRLAEGRKYMGTAFEEMCALVNKRGYCYQCSELRDVLPTERQGSAPALLASEGADDEAADAPAAYRLRLPVVRSHDHSQRSPVHDYIRRFMSARFD